MTAALRTGTPRRVGNLPFDTTSFFGRRREIGQIRRLLSNYRVVTITGPGGVGKTRLAVRTAGDTGRAFRNNVWFVELGELRDPSLLGTTVAETLGLYDHTKRSPIDTVIDHVADSPTLLLLDNCEHLVDEVAAFVDRLIRNCPGLTVMATSRQSLGLVGESTFAVAPLQVPDPDHVRSPDAVMQYDSVLLFAERAAAVWPHFSVTEQNYRAVARLCHDLDGMPLAIELAAARLRALSLDQIVERLRERFRLLSGGARGAPTRQRTLRALIDWSYELCSERERHVWARAAVFSGSFDLAAAEYVAGGGLDPADVYSTVDSLLDKSILMREEHGATVRYRMLETIREYGEDMLAEAGELTAVRRRHRDWYGRLAARFEAEWIGPHQVDWVRRLQREHPNLRVALEFCAQEPGEAVAGLRLAARLDDYWAVRGLYTELRHWLDRTLRVATEPTPERVAGLRMNAWYATLQGDIPAARRLLADAVMLNGALGVEAERAYLIQATALGALFSGDRDTAVTLFGEALAAFRAARDMRGELISLMLLGATVGLHGDPEKGLALLHECIGKATALGEVGWRSWALWEVTQIEVPYGSLDDADSAAREALELHQRLGMKLAMAFALDTLAWIAERRDQHTRAAELFGAASTLWDAVGASPENYMGFETQHRRQWDRARKALGDAAFDAAFQHGRQLPTDAAVNLALGRRPVEAAAPPPSPRKAPLTRREGEIAELVAEGMTNRDIAERLVISPRTADTHVEHILTKLGFTSRAQIASWVAAQKGRPPGTT
ncbi:ATP-binding protein [Gandjariella thermophila]|uniref:LuxR family transcriptional regulator n=1 Tax=Gandjariella thermophila TaxID=1931992 RepID=A0A4D4JBJ5_9PSEU|nr:LuxR C-terminal-related transcriptional regulator [Gandjariella thermophila]GDY31297.1 LuxR family transcriptional regulator [Gandjariella thermophila]